MFLIPKTTKQWVSGVVSAFVSSAAGGVGVVIVAPATFNLAEGKTKLLEMCIVFGIIGLANFLKTHPVPDDDESTPNS